MPFLLARVLPGTAGTAGVCRVVPVGDGVYVPTMCPPGGVAVLVAAFGRSGHRIKPYPTARVHLAPPGGLVVGWSGHPNPGDSGGDQACPAKLA
jgi:hypothetical protein